MPLTEVHKKFLLIAYRGIFDTFGGKCLSTVNY